MEKLVVGTRGSELAVTQTSWVINRLKKEHTDLEIEVKTVKTTGDVDQKTDLDKFSGLGVFVKELQSALLKGEIDCAVHSLKDVPEKGPEGLALVSFPEREDARDIFISKGMSLMKLPEGAKVGTGSPRRVVQLQQLRPDLEYVALRGNLDTRIKKVTDCVVDGIVLAAAGVKRLGRQNEITRYFSFDQMIPAIGQGSLALECRSRDGNSKKIAASINNPLTEVAVMIEREFMTMVGGGCKVPMACHVYPYDGDLRMMAAMGDLKTKNISRVETTISLNNAEAMVRDLCRDLLEDCREKSIPVPKDLPDHALLKNGPDTHD